MNISPASKVSIRDSRHSAVNLLRDSIGGITWLRGTSAPEPVTEPEMGGGAAELCVAEGGVIWVRGGAVVGIRVAAVSGSEVGGDSVPQADSKISEIPKTMTVISWAAFM